MGTVKVRTSTGWQTLSSSPTVPLVTGLPVGPLDGQEVYYQSAAMATDGLIWHLRYRAASASIYKWEVIAASPLMTAANADYTPASTGTAFAAAGAPGDGPTLTAPLAGEYEIGWDWKNDGSAANSNLIAWVCRAGVQFASPYILVPAAASGLTSSWWSNPAGDFTQKGLRVGKAIVPNAGEVVSVRYSAGVAAAKFGERFLSLRPVRVG